MPGLCVVIDRPAIIPPPPPPPSHNHHYHHHQHHHLLTNKIISGRHRQAASPACRPLTAHHHPTSPTTFLQEGKKEEGRCGRRVRGDGVRGRRRGWGGKLCTFLKGAKFLQSFYSVQKEAAASMCAQRPAKSSLFFPPPLPVPPPSREYI